MESKIQEFITNHPDWYQDQEDLVAGFEFSDFTAVQNVIPKIMEIAAQHDHHPTVTFGYNTIEIRTCTHDAGDVITEKDLTIAAAVSDVVAQ